MDLRAPDHFLRNFVCDFAAAMHIVDARRPIAPPFQPGLGPHDEDAAVAMCLDELARVHPDLYGSNARGVKYPAGSRAKCDLCFGSPGQWDWAIEAKLLRFLGDNGKQNGHMLMHILSPYPRDRSALTDCLKLVETPPARRTGVLIFGYHHDDWPLEPAIEAFELPATPRVKLGERYSAQTGPLIHPVHASGRVFGWEVCPRKE